MQHAQEYTGVQYATQSEGECSLAKFLLSPPAPRKPSIGRLEYVRRHGVAAIASVAVEHLKVPLE